MGHPFDLEALRNKVEWEGGVDEAIAYGIKSTDIDPSLTEIREAWAAAEELAAPYFEAVRRLNRMIEVG